ncbi:MAG: tRNA (adenosine(37)-N6)-threonylcarbamoyltransferase complex dimerization subunit type 1 TsaB [Gammaproteobacteria bacterium]
MNNLLLIDTASPITSVALSVGSELLQQSDPGNRRAAQAALPMISSLLQQAGLAAGQLDGIAVVTGPGSFTGIRIGIGIAQGLCLGRGIPALPRSTLAGYAQAAQREFGHGAYTVVLPARNDEIYAGLYQAHTASLALLGREQVGQPGALHPVAAPPGERWTGLSNAPQSWPSIADSLGIEITAFKQLQTPLLADLLVLARASLQQGHQVGAAALLPNYVKDNMQYG